MIILGEPYGMVKTNDVPRVVATSKEIGGRDTVLLKE